MVHLFQNFMRGSLTGALSATGTSIASAEFADLIAIAGDDTLDITLDPQGLEGDPEIVRLTAHTAAATTATTILGNRGREGTVARIHPIGSEWEAALTAVHASTAAPFPDDGNYYDRYCDSASPIATGANVNTSITALLDQDASDTAYWIPTWDTTGEDGIVFPVAGLYRITYYVMTDVGLATGFWKFRNRYHGFEPGWGLFEADGAFSGVGNYLDLSLRDTLYIPAGGRIDTWTFKTTTTVNVEYFEVYVSKLA